MWLNQIVIIFNVTVLSSSFLIHHDILYKYLNTSKLLERRIVYKMFSLSRYAGLSRAGLNVSKSCFLEKLFGVKRDIVWCKLFFYKSSDGVEISKSNLFSNRTICV